jgi:tetratricopeptide (TPR) repeat protein
MREILVLVLAGEYDRAIELMDGRVFYRQEDVNVLHDYHVDAHLLKGKELLEAGDAEAALEEFLIADTYPDNQFIERPLRYERNPRIFYYTALAYEAIGNRRAAREFFSRALTCEDADNQFLYYQAMANTKTGKRKEAEAIFRLMIEMGEEQLTDRETTVDFFAKFGGDLTDNQIRGISYHILALGYMGLGDETKAKAYFAKSLEADVNQLWSKIYLESF